MQLEKAALQIAKIWKSWKSKLIKDDFNTLDNSNFYQATHVF